MNDSVKLKGKLVTLADEVPGMGTSAQDFTFVKTDLSEDSLYDYDGVKVLISVPSLDTATCAAETRKFNEELSNRKGVTAFVISKDLPFAMKRFCETEGIKNVHSVSDYRYNEFGEEYNMNMLDGPLKGLLARAVFVLDKKNIIRYAELVEEVTAEPNYANALKNLDILLNFDK